MRTHRLPDARRHGTRALVWMLLVFPTLAGCLRDPAADAAAAQAITEMADELGALRQDNASLQGQVDSLRGVVARQDTVLRRLANMAGVPMP
jgi:uncharacterized protein (DUF1810 family)